MKVAISTDGNQVSAHFGRCPSFTIANIEDGQVLSKEIISNPGHRAGFLPEFLHGQGVECIIAGGMGNRASMLFGDSGIKIIIGVTGSVDETIEKLAEGTLKGGESLCSPGSGRGYGISRSDTEHGCLEKNNG